MLFSLSFLSLLFCIWSILRHKIDQKSDQIRDQFCGPFSDPFWLLLALFSGPRFGHVGDFSANNGGWGRLTRPVGRNENSVALLGASWGRLAGRLGASWGAKSGHVGFMLATKLIF